MVVKCFESKNQKRDKVEKQNNQNNQLETTQLFVMADSKSR